MTLNHRETAMLKWLSAAPRELHGFTALGTMGLSPKVAQTYLDHLTDEGYAERNERGVYSITSLGRCYLETRREPATSRVIGPWSTPAGSLSLAKWRTARPGADDASRVRSFGAGC